MAVRARTETRLLDAADELLFSAGVAATPVDAILERAGVSPATLYRAYGSKEGLVAAALRRRHREWLAVWDAEIARALDARGRLLAVLDALETFRARADGARWCAFLGTAAESVDPSPALADALRQETETLRSRLRELAAPVAAAGAGTPEELAEALLLVVSGELAMRLRAGAAPGGGVARAVAETLVDRAANGR